MEETTPKKIIIKLDLIDLFLIAVVCWLAFGGLLFAVCIRQAPEVEDDDENPWERFYEPKK